MFRKSKVIAEDNGNGRPIMTSAYPHADKDAQDRMSDRAWESIKHKWKQRPDGKWEQR